MVVVLLIGSAVGSILFVHRIEQSRRSEAAQRVRAEDRQSESEQLINFMLGDLADRLEPLGRLDVLESHYFAGGSILRKNASQPDDTREPAFAGEGIISVRGHSSCSRTPG